VGNRMDTHYFTGKPCVRGHLSPRRVKDRVCMGCEKEKTKLFRAEKPELSKASKRESYKRNAEKACAQKKVYRESNRGKINALNTARKKVVKQQTPAWLTAFDKLKIKCMYQVAAMYTKESGEPWHVDHIVPLQGTSVSGLHTPLNLRVIRGTENLSKKNKYEVVHG